LTEELGWSVAAADSADLDAAAAVVVASHGRDEEQALRAALRAGVPYVGLVASRKRGEAVLATLDLCASTTSRVRTPAGLDLGARTPQEVALTILAEILASRPRPTGRPLESESAVERAVDPVCGMTVAAVESSLHLDHEGQRVWFCGTGCLRAFAADPASYS
jgi:xanthine dehydrogenase accessory factor